MKILIIIPNDILGGAEQYLKMIADHFKSCDVHIFFLHPKKTNGWSDLDGKIKMSYSSSPYLPLGIIDLGLYLYKMRKSKFDFVFTSHVYYTGITGLFIRFGLLKKHRFIARESTSIFKRFSGFKLWSYKLMYKLGYPQVDLLVCQTELMKNQLIEGLPELTQGLKVRVIPNPINLKNSEVQSDDAINLEVPKSFVVTAGRLIPEKGFDLLIEAFGISQKTSNSRLVILGEGRERAELENLIQRLNLEDRVLLFGHVDNVYHYFKKADACIVSSRIEGFPNVLLQMMSVNNRVGSTLCAGGIEDIPGIHTCLPNSIEELTTLLDRTLAESRDNRSVFDNFLKERSVENHINTIESYTRQ